MIDEIIQIAIDPVFEPECEQTPKDRFELIYQEGQLNQRRSYDLDLCYPFPELKPFIGRKENPMPTVRLPQVSAKITQSKSTNKGRGNSKKLLVS